MQAPGKGGLGTSCAEAARRLAGPPTGRSLGFGPSRCLVLCRHWVPSEEVCSPEGRVRGVGGGHRGERQGEGFTFSHGGEIRVTHNPGCDVMQPPALSRSKLLHHPEDTCTVNSLTL